MTISGLSMVPAMPDHNYFSNLIWQIADLLRGPYRPPQYERVMLPMTVLRRFDCVLAPTKARFWPSTRSERAASSKATRSTASSTRPPASASTTTRRSTSRS
jgi:type I restriction-modification system DNA methylase subunit